MTHESGWVLGVGRGKRAYWENDKFIELALAVAVGDFATIEADDWQPGY